MQPISDETTTPVIVSHRVGKDLLLYEYSKNNIGRFSYAER